MKEIKGTYRSEECFEYKVHGKTYWITPDNSGIYWNGKKCRLEYDENFKEAFFYWLDNYHYKLLDSDILDLIDRAKDAYVGYYEDLQTFVEEMFDAESPECTERIKYYIDFDLYEKELMYDFFEIDGHIFKQ